MAEPKQAVATRQKVAEISDLSSMLERHGNKIILPEGLTIEKGIEYLMKIKEEQEVAVAIYETVTAFPLEGAYAFMKAMQRMFGWATPLPAKGFFDAPPVTVNLEVGYKQYTQVIWGKFGLPGVEGKLETGVAEDHGRMIFAIRGSVRKKHLANIKILADLTREIVAKESIYRGQPIKINVNEHGHMDYNNGPSFLDLSGVREEELVYPADTTLQVAANLFAPIEKTQQCRALGVPLKRAVLMEGPYGTGKTLGAFVCGKKAVENGWTFIMIPRVSGLKAALELARDYQPCVIFAEDIDREVSGEERTMKIDDILNTIDGIESKSTEVMVVLTSNHATELNRAMLRPGRLDAVIHVDHPDAPAVEKLVRLYGRGQIGHDLDISEVCKAIAGRPPAVIREVVERAKLVSIHRGERQGTLTSDDLMGAVVLMKRQLQLLDGPQERETSDHEKLGAAVAKVMGNAVQTSHLDRTAAVSKAIARIAKEMDVPTDDLGLTSGN